MMSTATSYGCILLQSAPTQSLTEDFIGCPVVETLPGSIIQFFDDRCNFFFRVVDMASLFKAGLGETNNIIRTSTIRK